MGRHAFREDNTMTKAFSYLRVSGMSQVEGDGLQRQREKVEAFAVNHGYEIVQEFSDEGVSGTKDHLDRPGLSALMLAMAGNGVRVMLIERADRLARNLMVGEIALEEFRKIEAKVISVDLGADLIVSDEDDPTKKLFRQFLGAIAEWEKTVLVHKLRLARMRIKQQNGKCEGITAFGSKDEEKPIVSRMLELKSKGYTTSMIAAKLNEEGAKTRMNAQWHRTSVIRVIERQKPCGDL